MNKTLLLALIIPPLTVGVAVAAPRKIAYEHGHAIFVADIDGTHAKKIAIGVLPEILPDGTRVAFNTEGDAKNRPGPERRIAIADVETGKVTILEHVPGDNCFGPTWSPNGKWIAFSILHGKDWQIGVIRWDGDGFHLIENNASARTGMFAPAWGHDSISIFCHDLDGVYQVDRVNGNLLNKWELAKILADASMNSGDRLSVSPDGKSLLMDVDCGAEHERKNWDGPQPAIERFELGAEKAVRVTGKNDFVWEPFWLSPNEFLCIMQKENENEPSIYQMSIDGKNPKLIVKHARTPSASAP